MRIVCLPVNVSSGNDEVHQSRLEQYVRVLFRSFKAAMADDDDFIPQQLADPPPAPPALKGYAKIKEKDPSIIVVSAVDRLRALASRSFTRPKPWVHLLPHPQDAEADEWISEILCSLTATVLVDDMSGVSSAIEELLSYHGKFGMRFTYDQHCKLIRLLFGIFTRRWCRAETVSAAASAFATVVEGSRLDRTDFTLDWRPVADQYEHALFGKNRSLSANSIQIAVRISTRFFEAGSDRLIWKRIRPEISMSGMGRVGELLQLLPTSGHAKGELEPKDGEDIEDFWLPVLWKLYESMEMNDTWTVPVLNLFIRLTSDSPSAAVPFFVARSPLLFSRVMRSLALTARDGKILVASDAWLTGTVSYGSLIGQLIGVDPCIETQLFRMLDIVESHAHPGRGGQTNYAMVAIMSLILAATVYIMKRVRKAATDKYRHAAPPDRPKKKKDTLPPISESTLTRVGEAFIRIWIPSIHLGIDSEVLRLLAFLRPGIVLPKLLDQFYPALTAVNEPERLTNSMAPVNRMLFLMALDRGEGERRPLKRDWTTESAAVTQSAVRRRKKKKSSSSSGSSQNKKNGVVKAKGEPTSLIVAGDSLRPHLVHIAAAVIDSIDVNDIDRSVLALETFTTLFAVLPMVDCSQGEAEEKATGEKSRLIELSAQLPGIAEKLLDKVLCCIEALCTNATNVATLKDSNAVQAAQGKDESALESGIGVAVAMLFENVDTDTAKKLSSKLLHFVRTSILDNSTAVSIVSNVINQCTYEHPACYGDFMKWIAGAVAVTIDDEVQRSEQLTGSAAYLTAIAPSFCNPQPWILHAHLKDAIGMAHRLLACKSPVAYESGIQCFSYMLNALLRPVIVYDPPEERYKGRRRPSELWAPTEDMFTCSRAWRCPQKVDIDAATSALSVSLFPAMAELAEPAKLSRDAMRKALSTVASLFAVVVAFTPFPSPLVAPPRNPFRDNGLPQMSMEPTLAFRAGIVGELTAPGGKNLRETIASIMEGVISCGRKVDAREHELVLEILRQCRKIAPPSYASPYAGLCDIVQHAILRDHAKLPGTIDIKLAGLMDKDAFSRWPSVPSQFIVRIARATLDLAFSLYETVRYDAREQISVLLSHLSETTFIDEVMDRLEAILTDPKASYEMTKAALVFIRHMKMPAKRRPQMRTKIWPLLLKTPRPEDTELLQILDECYDLVGGKRHYYEPVPPLDPSFLSWVRAWLGELPRVGEWASIPDLDAALVSARATVLRRAAIHDQANAGLLEWLHAWNAARSAPSATRSSPIDSTMRVLSASEKDSESAIPDSPAPLTARSVGSVDTAVGIASPLAVVGLASDSTAATPTASWTKIGEVYTPPQTPSPKCASPYGQKSEASIPACRKNLIHALATRPSSATPSLRSDCETSSRESTPVQISSPNRVTSPSIATALISASRITLAIASSCETSPMKSTARSSSSCSSLSSTEGVAPMRKTSEASPRSHIRQIDLVTDMILLLENRRITPRTMKEILLPRMIDDRVAVRELAQSMLLYWLRKNKPKTAREAWKPPPKVKSGGPSSLCFGLRPDNLLEAYDSTALPRTAEAWAEMRFFSKEKGHFAWPDVISLPARDPIPSGRVLSAVDTAVIAWFSNKNNISTWLQRCLPHRAEEEDSFDTGVAYIVKYVLRNYPDQSRELLANFKDAFNYCITLKNADVPNLTFDAELASRRLASELFTGIAIGTRYLPFPVLDELWKWLAPTVIAQMDVQNVNGTGNWTSAMYKLRRDDFRRYWWLYEALLASLSAPEKMSREEVWKPANRLALCIFQDWRSSEFTGRMASICLGLAPLSFAQSIRGPLGESLGDSALLACWQSDVEGIPERFRQYNFDRALEAIAKEACKMSRQKSPEISALFMPNGDVKEAEATAPRIVEGQAPEDHDADTAIVELSAAMEKMDKIESSIPAPIRGRMSLSAGGAGGGGGGRPARGALPSRGAAAADNAEENKFVSLGRLLLEALGSFFLMSNRSVTPGIVRIFPLLAELAVENDGLQEEGLEKLAELREDASYVVHQFMSSIVLTPEMAQHFTRVIGMLLSSSSLQSQRTSAIRFFHVLVFSNAFVFDAGGDSMKEAVRKIVLDALLDKEILVRREAANALTTFVHCGFLSIDVALMDHFRAQLSSSATIPRQSAALGFAAIVRAFPDTFETKVVPALVELCRLSSSSKDVIVQQWATNALRDFRASHRDHWSTDAEGVIGPYLFNQIESELSPHYYV